MSYKEKPDCPTKPLEALAIGEAIAKFKENHPELHFPDGCCRHCGHNTARPGCMAKQ